MAELPTAELRNRVHQVLDPLWMNALDNGGYRESKKRFLLKTSTRQFQKIARERVYAWLAEQMWLRPADCHAARFTIDQCHEAISLLENVTYVEIRKWAQRQKSAQKLARMEARAC
ncbi:hypothetical protein [Methylobacterium sp. WL19]|uniref:hypothetical protein n=1 Tax=Methylobacterium sp. WL19 TaxID=2603896 RepID=UPI001650CDF6|nr:hypothetical protein [Methylobacterium sp. WL19]